MFIKRTARAFALVELLVVIGIIGLLFSMCLPAYIKTRQRASVIDCTSNLHQIGTLLQIYIEENHGFFPYGHAQMAYENRLAYLDGPNETAQWDWPDSLTRLLNKGTSEKPLLTPMIT